MPNWLLTTMNTTGSRHSAARLSVSPNVPWLEAPSPNAHSVTSSRTAVVAAQTDARADRQVAADDPVAAHEATLEIEHVHRAAVPAAAAVDAPEQLGHHPLGRGPARERVPVRAVGRDQIVLLAQRPRRADDRRLLADRQVQEPADLRPRVHLPGALLEAADQRHRRKPLARDGGLRQVALKRAGPRRVRFRHQLCTVAQRARNSSACSCARSARSARAVREAACGGRSQNSTTSPESISTTSM